MQMSHTVLHSPTTFCPLSLMWSNLCSHSSHLFGTGATSPILTCICMLACTVPHTHNCSHLLSRSHTHSHIRNYNQSNHSHFTQTITYATSLRTFAHYPHTETCTHLFTFVLAVLCLPHHRSHLLMLASTLLHIHSRRLHGYVTDHTRSPMCTHFPIIPWLTFACPRPHAHVWHSHSTSLTPFVHDICIEAHAFAQCSSKYFLLQCHMFEGLGDLIRAILLVLDGAHTVVSFYLILFLLLPLFLHYILWKLSCHWWHF